MPFICTLAGSLGYGRSDMPSTIGPPSGLGLTSNNPGSNALAIYNAGNTSNGYYWIQTSVMSSANQVYCNMDDGAWMLVSYNGHKNDAVAARRGQYYPVAWSNELGNGVLGGQFAVNMNDLWYSGASNQCTELMRLAYYQSNAIPTISNAYIGHRVTYTSSTNFLGLTVASGVQGTGVFSASNTLMRATWSSIKGFSSLSTHITQADSDLLYNTGTNFYWNPCLPIGGTSRSGSGLNIGGWTRTQDKDTWGMSNVTPSASSAGSSFPGSTLAVYIR